MFTEHFPEIGWLSEETRDNSDRFSKELVWIVDLIDGTKEFVSGIPEYAISVALIQRGTGPRPNHESFEGRALYGNKR